MTNDDTSDSKLLCLHHASLDLMAKSAILDIGRGTVSCFSTQNDLHMHIYLSVAAVLGPGFGHA